MTALLRAVQTDDGNRYDWGRVCLGWRLLELLTGKSISS